jgi:hypothetical protein
LWKSTVRATTRFAEGWLNLATPDCSERANYSLSMARFSHRPDPVHQAG